MSRYVFDASAAFEYIVRTPTGLWGTSINS